MKVLVCAVREVLMSFTPNNLPPHSCVMGVLLLPPPPSDKPPFVFRAINLTLVVSIIRLLPLNYRVDRENPHNELDMFRDELSSNLIQSHFLSQSILLCPPCISLPLRLCHYHHHWRRRRRRRRHDHFEVNSDRRRDATRRRRRNRWESERAARGDRLTTTVTFNFGRLSFRGRSLHRFVPSG